MSRFIVGFLIGAAIGAGAVVFTSPRASESVRAQFSGVRPGGKIASLRAQVGNRLQQASAVAQQASEAREKQLWAQYRSQIS